MQSDSNRHPSAAATIEFLRETTLATLVHRELERQITSGEIAIGAKLNESDIAGALGVSRGPVREAFRALDQDGLVRAERNRGVFVRQLTLEDANEIYEVRAVLEGLIGRLAAERIDAGQAEQLRIVVKKMAALKCACKPKAYFALNVEFHEILAGAAHNDALSTRYRRVLNELNLYRRELLSRGTDQIPISTREHEAIVNAVARGDAGSSERLMHDHALRSRERLHNALAKPAAHRARTE